MSLKIMPIVGCNFQCTGCYEGEIFRKNGGKIPPYDLDKMIETVRSDRDKQVYLFGGEITLLPFDKMSMLIEAMVGMGKRVSMQTNASNITPRHIELFSKHHVGVGVSLNGPEELNRDRRIGDVAATDRMTARIHSVLADLRSAGVSCGLIVTLSKTNCGDDEKLRRLIQWGAEEIGRNLGVRHIRWNLLGQDDKPMSQDIELTPERGSEIYVALSEATLLDPLREWLPFREFVDNLMGFPVSPCWMATCDPYSTAAVRGVLGDGSIGNCPRTSDDGVITLQDDHGRNYVRQDLLLQIPFESGGCGGCRWWRVCHGGCPAEGSNADWRNKTRFCQVFIDTYSYLERRLKEIMPRFYPVVDWSDTEYKVHANSVRLAETLVLKGSTWRKE